MLVFVAGLFALHFLFSVQLGRALGIKVAALLFAALLAGARLRLAPSKRLVVALSLLPAVLALGAFEKIMASARPRRATAALTAGRPFDARSRFEVLRDLRKTDPTAQSFVFPRGVLTRTIDARRAGNAYLEHTVREDDWGVVAGGERLLPLGGVSMRQTVFCNESGSWVVYDSDERGYNNPRGLWGAGPLDLVLLGDSFSQGDCVPPGRDIASHLREAYPSALTLGMCSNGPLIEYANLKEHVVERRPKIVLWQYYSNDWSDLDIEAQSPLLRRYLDDDAFRQGLAAKQTAIDRALDAYLDEGDLLAPRFPGALESIGLTRATTPLVLQDLIMGERNVTGSAIARLDFLTDSLSGRFFETNYLHAPPNEGLFRRVLEKARDTVAAWGGAMYFVYTPDLHFVASRGKRQNARRAEVLRTVADLKIPLIDVHAAFEQLPKPDLRYYDDSHVDEEGYAKMAEIILAALGSARSPK